MPDSPLLDWEKVKITLGFFSSCLRPFSCDLPSGSSWSLRGNKTGRKEEN